MSPSFLLSLLSSLPSFEVEPRPRASPGLAWQKAGTARRELRDLTSPAPRRILPAISARQVPAQFSLFVTPEKMTLSPASQNYFWSIYTCTFHSFQGNLPQPALQKCSYSWCSQKGGMAKEMFRFFMD